MEGSYNARCPAVKRLLKEAQELHEATEEYFAQPVEDNLFEWHFTVRGPPDTEFDGGIYHGRIIMPPEYPMKPPNIIFFTPNGRFETNKKICLSISGHHPESWQPSWSIRTALLAMIGFMPSPASGTIGALDYTAAERKVLAKRSSEFECTICGRVKSLLKDRTGDNQEFQKEAREVLAQMTVTTKDIEENNGHDTGKDKKDSVTSSEKEPCQNPSLDVNETVSSTTSVTETSTTDSIVSSNQTSTSTVSSTPLSNSNVSNTPAYNSTPTTLVTAANSPFSLSLRTNNIILFAAVMLLIALVIRRVFLIGVDNVEEI